MALLSFVPNLLQEAEKAVPGHGAELVQALDAVSTASFFLGVGVGVFSVFIVVQVWSCFVSWARGRRDAN